MINALKENHSWCGETHIQKAGYCLQNIAEVHTGFDFILYKHGPFSFDLRDELTAMRADELLDISVNNYPYGPNLSVTEFGQAMIDRFPKTIEKHNAQIDYIAKALGSKGVGQLERFDEIGFWSEVKLSIPHQTS